MAPGDTSVLRTPTTLVLSNDATAIVLTPLVYAAVARRDGNAMPYLYACAFAANTASFGLPFSNPANILILPHPQLAEYLSRLALPQTFAILWNAAAFAVVFRTSLAGTYSFERPEPPAPRVLRTLAALAVVAAAYFAALAFGVPLGPVAAGGAVLALLVAEVRPMRVLQRISWRTLLLVAGLFALLDAVARAGFVTWAIAQLQHVAQHGPAAASALTVAGAALFSNLLNNLPVAIVASYVAAHPGWHHLAYPAIVGVDLGPNLSTTGSLATLLWLAILSERGVRVNPLHYARLGLIVVPPALAFSWLWLSMLR
jgi:arsenical pump membrane protein